MHVYVLAFISASMWSTHTHTAAANGCTCTLMAKGNCDCKHNLLKLAEQVFALPIYSSSPFYLLLFIPFSSFLYRFLSTFVYNLFKIVIVSPLHIFSIVTFCKSSQCESLCIHHCFSAVIFDSINPFAADDSLLAVLGVPACVNSEFSK